jgi:hypothetical protein
MSDNQTVSEIYGTLAFLHSDEDEVFEVRAFVAGRTYSGYFNDRIKAEEEAKRLSAHKECRSVYVTLNPCNPALLARAENRVRPCYTKDDKTTSDHDVARLHNLLVDIDAERPSGISSSDQEHEAALAFAQTIRSDLATTMGWPDPLVGDSGNGGHLVYKIDMDNTPDNVNLVKRVLQGLHAKYAGEDGKITVNGVRLSIDQTVYNPARITKLFGTWVRKGDNIPERPHRQARVLSFPQDLCTVTQEQLVAVAASPDTKQSITVSTLGRHPDQPANFLNVRAYLANYGVEVLGEKVHGLSTLYLLKECPFDPSHRGGEAAIGQQTNGALFYKCFHDSCHDKTWHDVRQKISGSDPIKQFMPDHKPKAQPVLDPAGKDSKPMDAENDGAEWELAREHFPRIEFPWDVFPQNLIKSLQNLAKACATSLIAIPGIVFCLLASVLGRSIMVSPKTGWREPMILWYADIRYSGDGKTPNARMLSKAIKEYQKKEHRRYEAEKKHYDGLPKDEKQYAEAPTKPRGYFATDLTLEGLRYDLVGHPTGGLCVIQDELSGFISAQNQYKARGNDRESWLILWDGHAARIIRKDSIIFLDGVRVSIFGGIQPGVFARVFNQEEGLYLVDGTLFRFLLTFEPARHYPLDETVWTENNRLLWESTVKNAMNWTDGICQDQGGQIDDPHVLLFQADAQERFFSWRNALDQLKEFLPVTFRGFIPKAASYAVRLAGILHCLHTFSNGDEPGHFISLEDFSRALKLMEFYLGQAVDALMLLCDESHDPEVVDERIITLGETLEALRDKIDNGRLAVSFIRGEFNRRAKREHRFSEEPKSKTFGLFLRANALEVSDNIYDANGFKRVRCLSWNQATEVFLTDVHVLLDVLREKETCGSMEREEPQSSSRSSLEPESIWGSSENKEKTEDYLLGLSDGSAEQKREQREEGEDDSLEKVACACDSNRILPVPPMTGPYREVEI